MVSVALYQPDIPQNLGSILRLCACMGVACEIVEPCGFVLDAARMKRVVMDYEALATQIRHASWEQFMQARAGRRIVLLSTKGKESVYDFGFETNDILLMGRESAGVPESVAAKADAVLRLPMKGSARSLNLAVATGMALGEALRQTRWRAPDQRVRSEAGPCDG